MICIRVSLYCVAAPRSGFFSGFDTVFLPVFHFIFVFTLVVLFALIFLLIFFFYFYGHHRDLHVLTHSFPTRRSSDLTNLTKVALSCIHQAELLDGLAVEVCFPPVEQRLFQLEFAVLIGTHDGDAPHNGVDATALPAEQVTLVDVARRRSADGGECEVCPIEGAA